MPIMIKKGDIFTSKAMAIVNPVNIVGVMGKGLAKDFKIKYNDCFLSYKKACALETIGIGRLQYYRLKKINHPTMIINFPTKKHWKDPSKYEYIEYGLKDFMNNYRDKGITSVAFPMLGIGNGKLEKEKVLEIMKEALKDAIIEVEIWIN